jgi:hypothetical protein
MVVASARGQKVPLGTFKYLDGFNSVFLEGEGNFCPKREESKYYQNP